MVKDKVYWNVAEKSLYIDGKPYQVSLDRKTLKGHSGNPVFKEREQDYEERVKKAAKWLAEKSPALKVEDLIAEALKGYPPRDLARLERSIKKKRKVKRENGCISLNVGGQIITIVG